MNFRNISYILIAVVVMSIIIHYSTCDASNSNRGTNIIRNCTISDSRTITITENGNVKDELMYESYPFPIEYGMNSIVPESSGQFLSGELSPSGKIIAIVRGRSLMRGNSQLSYEAYDLQLYNIESRTYSEVIGYHQPIYYDDDSQPFQICWNPNGDYFIHTSGNLHEPTCVSVYDSTGLDRFYFVEKPRRSREIGLVLEDQMPLRIRNIKWISSTVFTLKANVITFDEIDKYFVDTMIIGYPNKWINVQCRLEK